MMLRVNSHEMHYANEWPHKYSETRMCTCVRKRGTLCVPLKKTKHLWLSSDILKASQQRI